jgi:hypothetical protein
VPWFEQPPLVPVHTANGEALSLTRLLVEATDRSTVSGTVSDGKTQLAVDVSTAQSVVSGRTVPTMLERDTEVMVAGRLLSPSSLVARYLRPRFAAMDVTVKNATTSSMTLVSRNPASADAAILEARVDAYTMMLDQLLPPGASPAALVGGTLTAFVDWLGGDSAATLIALYPFDTVSRTS